MNSDLDDSRNEERREISAAECQETSLLFIYLSTSIFLQHLYLPFFYISFSTFFARSLTLFFSLQSEAGKRAETRL